MATKKTATTTSRTTATGTDEQTPKRAAEKPSGGAKLSREEASAFAQLIGAPLMLAPEPWRASETEVDALALSVWRAGNRLPSYARFVKTALRGGGYLDAIAIPFAFIASRVLYQREMMPHAMVAQAYIQMKAAEWQSMNTKKTAAAATADAAEVVRGAVENGRAHTDSRSDRHGENISRSRSSKTPKLDARSRDEARFSDLVDVENGGISIADSAL